jgi:hypothetical protein
VKHAVLTVAAAGLVLTQSACGGSSSETPFPIEPDFARIDAGGPPRADYVVFTGRGGEARKMSEDAGAPSDDEPPPER